MKKIYDVVVVGAGPAGLYSSIILKKGTPMQVPSEPIKVAVTEATKIGGLTQYAFIQITKKWAFSGRNLIATLYSEAMEAGVDFYKNFFVKKIYKRKDGYFCVESSDRTLISKFVIVATGILTFPNILDNPSKTNIGLHTPEEMTREIVNDYHWKSVLIVGTNKMSVKTLAHKINNLGEFKKIDYYVSNLSTTMLEKNYGINGVDIANYDGLLFDYNSYKLNNGSTYFLKDLDIVQENGYIVTNNFGETAVSGLFAVGSVTMPTSGVPQAIYSAQITGLYVGHLLEKTTIADYSGRFPFFPREENWKYSFQHKLEKDNK
jgi:thioredoxin reductase